MTQSASSLVISSPVSGTSFRGQHNNQVSDLATNFMGSSRPSTAVAGMMWIKQVTASSWILYLFDGTDDIAVGTANTSGNTFTTTNAEPIPLFRTGLIITNNATDPTNDIDIGVGAATESGNAYTMVLSTGLTKRLDAAWTAGTNQGGRDTGSIADAWWHCYLIRNSSTGVVDALFSQSASSPTMPSGYDQKYCFASFLRSGGAIVSFKQRGSKFLWVDPPLDLNTSAAGTTSALFTASVPTGFNVDAILNAYMSAGGDRSVYFSSPDVNDEASSVTAAPLAQLAEVPTSGSTRTQGGQIAICTNTSAQIRYVASAASTTIRVATIGWEDYR